MMPHDNNQHPGLVIAVRDEVINAMREAGIPPHDPSEVVINGNLHRYRVEGDRAGRRNGWVVGFLDANPVATFGSWKAGVTRTWSAKPGNVQTGQVHRDSRQRVKEAQQKREAEIARLQHRAAERAQRLWHRAEGATPSHPYLRRKGITPGTARQLRTDLLLPVFSLDGTIQSLQFISETGQKRLLSGGAKKGGAIPAGGQRGSDHIQIAEGWATARTVAEANPHALSLASIDAGNLLPVALECRRRWPSSLITICADNDKTGREHGRQAAQLANARLAIPPTPGFDWNDEALKMEGGDQDHE